MYNILIAIALFLTNNNIWCAAFPSVVIFGEVESESSMFVKKKYFSFFKSDFVSLYKALISVCHTVAQNSATKNLQETKGIILERFETIYSWSVYYVNSNVRISFTIEISLETAYVITFSLDDFNDFIFVLSRSLIPSLCLQLNITNSLHKICTFSLNDLKCINTPEDCNAFVKKNNLDEKINIYLLYYKEIIIIVHKLMTLYNPQIKAKIIEEIINFKL